MWTTRNQRTPRPAAGRTARPPRRTPSRPQTHTRPPSRRGSTLLIVLVLMTMLASLGVIFYVFAAQERQTAEFYSEAGKVTEFDLTVDTLMDFAMEQLIVGPDPKYKNSALYGRRHSLLGNMLGVDPTGNSFDSAPYNGFPRLPANPQFLQLNDSPLANGGNELPTTSLAGLEPDYTYPDLNNLFLSYSGYDPVEMRRVIIPSFHRPQLEGIIRNSDWYSDTTVPGLRQRLLRPHPSHVYVPPPGQQPPATPVNRYMTAAQATAVFGGTHRGFPFQPYAGTGLTDGVQGVWSVSRWLPSTPYAVGDFVIPATFNGWPSLVYRCTSGGSSSSSEPAWPTEVADTVNEGTVTWRAELMTYGYDVDNDGDGIREGIWLDIDFPVQETSDGLLYVPLVSFTVIDADGLINLNAHGNLARVWGGDIPMTAPFGGPVATQVHASRSNQGIMPAEVNPSWAMNRRAVPAGSTLSGYEDNYPSSSDTFFAGTPPLNWWETANREQLFLLMGRLNSGATNDLLPGRWGEEQLLYSAISNSTTRNPFGLSLDLALNPLANPWPGPGQTRIDDNGDLLLSTGGWIGATVTSFSHPMDFAGLGRTYLATAGTHGKAADYLAGFGSSRARWPRYTRYSNDIAVASVRWPARQSDQASTLFNDSAESVLDADNRRPEDNLFGPDEMRALHLNRDDFRVATGDATRLTKLAPYNLDPLNVSGSNLTGKMLNTDDWNSATTPASPPSGLAIGSAGGLPTDSRPSQQHRGQFTTLSWDRKQFSLPASPIRPWEYTSDADQDGKLEFPPRFYITPPGPGIFEYWGLGASGYTPPIASDPFRPVLRKLVEVELNEVFQSRPQLRLNVNRLLVGPNGNPFPLFPHPNSAGANAKLAPNIELNERPLTPHPDQTLLTAAPLPTPSAASFVNGPDMYPSSGVFAALPMGSSFATVAQWQEFWARMDRQLMARDLFVLLYYLGWPDTIDPRSVDPTDPDSSDEIRRMAQFAVNVVDSLDVDNIPTRFEFDFNLLDGWNLDENPYTVTDTDRYEVWGVERQDLVLSEGLAVRVPTDTNNYSFTPWDDADEQHFAFAEIRNPGPNAINFSDVLHEENWMLEVGPDPVSSSSDALFHRMIFSGGPSTLDPGQRFSIGSATNPQGGGVPSGLQIDPTGGSVPVPIVPPSGTFDFDLQDAAHAAWFRLRDRGGVNLAGGALYDASMDSLDDLYLRLYRRMSPLRPQPSTPAEEADNPWVMVDQLYLGDRQTITTSGTRGGTLDFDTADTATLIEGRLSGLQSVERSEPFAGVSTYHPAPGAAPWVANSIGGLVADPTRDNSNDPDVAFRRWQKVFDRDYTSIGELLQLTLGSWADPELLAGLSGLNLRLRTCSLTPSGHPNGTGNPPSVPNVTTTELDPRALNRFLLPDADPTGTAGTYLQHRWHRLLELLDVPTRMHRTIPGFTNPLDYPRVPGKINFNALRHPEVLAAMIDDPAVMSVIVDEDVNRNGVLDPGEDLDGDGDVGGIFPTRVRREDLVPLQTGYGPGELGLPVDNWQLSWWQGFLMARDSWRDPTTGYVRGDPLSGLVLPGTTLPSINPAAISRPFRSFTANPIAGEFSLLERSLLRSWPGDPTYVAHGTALSPPVPGLGGGVTYTRPRQLFELGNREEANATTDTAPTEPQALDDAVRLRLLNKMLNLSTNRSHVFAVFCSMKFFRAHIDPASGAVQVGGPLKPIGDPDEWAPEHRAFFVVDRSQLEKAYDPATGRYNFRALEQFRQILQ
jgi:hypothetical protein